MFIQGSPFAVPKTTGLNYILHSGTDHPSQQAVINMMPGILLELVLR